MLWWEQRIIQMVLGDKRIPGQGELYKNLEYSCFTCRVLCDLAQVRQTTGFFLKRPEYLDLLLHAAPLTRTESIRSV
jgi:hypothetical protein